MWPRLPASPRVATRKAIGEHPETRSSSLSSGCRVLSIASPVNTHLPVQARERTALNRQNATSLLTIPYQGEGSTRPFIFAHSPFTRALGGNASARLVRIAHYPCPLLCTCDTIQEKASARAPCIHPITISRALQVKASTRVHRLCSNLLLKRSARFVCLNLICALLCLCDRLRKGISKAHFPSFKPHLKGSARLQGFTLSGQYFFSRALQGFSKASLSKILVKGYAREGFNKRSSSSFNQSDTVPETNRYALPTS